MLAQNLLSKICAKLIEFLKDIITSTEFIARHRQSDKHFTRERKMPFHFLIVFLLNALRGSYQDQLDRFFKIFFRLDVADRVVSKAALTKARMKLKYQAFIELNHRLNDFFEKNFNPKTWFGFRLLVIDGSLIRLPRCEDIAKHFGMWKVRQGQPSPMARISQLYDTLNKITVDALIKPKHLGERDLAAQHLLNIMPTDLVLLDRGYPAWWLFALITSLDANFCSRISCTKWKIVRSFFQSNANERIIFMPPPITSIKTAKQMGLDLTPLKLRLIRIENAGKTQILITSLTDAKSYPYEVFADLYHKRWPVEEDYKAIKCRIEMENFSGQSALSVYQDFHSKVLLKNLVSVFALPVNDILANSTTSRKYDYKINFTQAISKSKDVIALMFQQTASKLIQLIENLQQIFLKTIEPIRPGRKYPRRRTVSSRKYFLNYKPIA
ncbi:MAG: IS4 family transposase [Proteobacteria bacterium]|nr:IS4 family transposase [Pseudomonadota bacterium]